MTWVKIDDKMVDHPKIAVLSHGAFHQHIAGLCYCSQHLTDGHVPAVIAHKLVKSGARFSQELVTRGVWEARNGGYEIHDYLDHQLSREDIKKRVESGRLGGKISKPPGSKTEALASEKPKQTGSTGSSETEATRAGANSRKTLDEEEELKTVLEDSDMKQPHPLATRLTAILPDDLPGQLTKHQAIRVNQAWVADEHRLRHSVAAIEIADKPVAYLIDIAKRILQDVDKPKPRKRERDIWPKGIPAA